MKPSMSHPQPARVLIVSYSPYPPLAESLAAAWERAGATTHIFHSWLCNTAFDRLIIHPLNHLAHNLRLLPKSVNLFEGHPKSHKEWRSAQLLRVFRQFQPQLVLITGIQRLKPEVLTALHQESRVFYWFTESEQRFGEVAGELPFYHHCYFISSLGLSRARDLGVERASLLPHAVDTALFRPLSLPFGYDWCFVGQWHPRRQQYIEGLAQVSGNLAIYGPRWRKNNWRRPSLWRRIKASGIWGEDLVRLYNQTRVVINISVWADEHRGGRGVNQRLLEVPACGACLLSDYTSDAELLLTPGRDFAMAESFPDMQRQLAELLAQEDKRQAMARRGYEKAAQLRSYDDLVAQVTADWQKMAGREVPAEGP